MLLGELIKKFPLPVPPQPKAAPATTVAKNETENGTGDSNKDVKSENKQDKVKPPPEKKPRIS